MKFSLKFLHTYCFIFCIKKKKSKICENWVVDRVAGSLSKPCCRIRFSIIRKFLDYLDFLVMADKNGHQIWISDIKYTTLIKKKFVKPLFWMFFFILFSFTATLIVWNSELSILILRNYMNFPDWRDILLFSFSFFDLQNLNLVAIHFCQPTPETPIIRGNFRFFRIIDGFQLFWLKKLDFWFYLSTLKNRYTN